MATCDICNVSSENLTEFKSYTVEKIKELLDRKKVGHKTYQETSLSFETDVQMHSYLACDSCIQKRDRVTPWAIFGIGLVLSVLVSFSRYNPNLGLGNFFYYFCIFFPFLAIGGSVLWLFEGTTDHYFRRKSVKYRKSMGGGKYEGFTEGAWEMRQKK